MKFKMINRKFQQNIIYNHWKNCWNSDNGFILFCSISFVYALIYWIYIGEFEIRLLLRLHMLIISGFLFDYP